jgi:hypothetical protein
MVHISTSVSGNISDWVIIIIIIIIIITITIIIHL